MRILTAPLWHELTRATKSDATYATFLPVAPRQLLPWVHSNLCGVKGASLRGGLLRVPRGAEGSSRTKNEWK